LKVIQDGHYDFVVLQEQSTLPIKNANRMHEIVRLFDEAIKAAGAKTVFYMTWARQHSPESQKAITDAYNTIGRELGAIVIPVGSVWENSLLKHDEPVLHDKLECQRPTSVAEVCVAAVQVTKEAFVSCAAE
jgi:hypothetical protein